ncbi:hypothetical protein BJV77DRAFT_1032841, partial [Russula vinacea]
SIMNPRRLYAERRGSRAQTRREFTIDPCRDRVSSRGGTNCGRRAVLGRG